MGRCVRRSVAAVQMAAQILVAALHEACRELKSQGQLGSQLSSPVDNVVSIALTGFDPSRVSRGYQPRQGAAVVNASLPKFLAIRILEFLRFPLDSVGKIGDNFTEYRIWRIVLCFAWLETACNTFFFRCQNGLHFFSFFLFEIELSLSLSISPQIDEAWRARDARSCQP